MKLEHLPPTIQGALRAETNNTHQQLAAHLHQRAAALHNELAPQLPASVTVDDLALWLLHALRDSLPTFTAWQVAHARNEGLTAERIAANLGYLTGGNMRRAFPAAATIEAAYRDGDTHITIDGYTLTLPN